MTTGARVRSPPAFSVRGRERASTRSPARPGGRSLAEQVLLLQRLAGNAAVAELLLDPQRAPGSRLATCHLQRCGPANPGCGCAEEDEQASVPPATLQRCGPANAAGSCGNRREHVSVRPRPALRTVVQSASEGGATSRLAAAAKYNASRYPPGAAEVLAGHVGASSRDPESEDFAAAVHEWQAAPARPADLRPDGKLGPASLGVVIFELESAGRLQQAGLLKPFPHMLAGQGQESADSSKGDSCSGKPKHGPGKVLETLDLPTVKRFDLSNFDIARSFLKDEHRGYLRKRFTDPAMLARLRRGWKIAVIGHASTTGDEEFNTVLSELRSICTRLFMLDIGVPAGTTEGEGTGEQVARDRLKKAGAPRTDDVESADDRRVEITVFKTSKPPPPKEEKNCPSADEFDEAMCEKHRWPEILDYCSQTLITDHIGSDAACQALPPMLCALHYLSGKNLGPTMEACCEIPDVSAEVIEQKLTDCVIKTQQEIMKKHNWFPDCPDLRTHERLLESLKRCLKAMAQN